MSTHLVLVINCGSSSLKFSLMDPQSGVSELNGEAERLCSDTAQVCFEYQGDKSCTALTGTLLTGKADHQAAVNAIVERIHELNLAESIDCVGHRVVHGGEHYSDPVRITPEVKAAIVDLAKLAPLHNTAHAIGIEATQAAFPHLPQVAVFDTAFHQTMPDYVYLYGLPYKLYREHGIRRYGFHGTSHDFVSRRAAGLLGKPREKIQLITAHLGSGCSVAAVAYGKCVDTSMGLTPQEGLMMGTRSGDVDPTLVFHLVEQLGYELADVKTLLTEQSGLLGISELSNDCRELEAAAVEGNKQATLALEVFCYRIARNIAAVSVGLTQLDALVFTGGIGENSAYIREKVVGHLAILHLALDIEKNQDCCIGKEGEGAERRISTKNAPACLVIPTNEEWVIAEQAEALVQASS